MDMSNEYRLRNGRTWMILNEAEAAARLAQNSDPGIRWLTSYTPEPSLIGRKLWDQRVGRFVRLQVARIVDTELRSVKRSARELTRIAAWQAPRMPHLDVDLVLDPAEVDRFARHLMAAGVNAATVNTVRSILRNLGRSLTTSAPWEPNPSAYKRQRYSEPYTPAEIRRILRDLPRQATSKRSSDGRGLAALGLGAGLDARWVARIRGVDVQRVGGLVVVSVPDPMARDVVVRSAYAEELVELAEAAGENFIVGTGSASKDAVNRIVARLEVDRGRLLFSPRQARNTFIVAHLNAGTHLDVLRQACGLRSFDAFRDLYQYLDPITADQARRQLSSA